MPTEVKRELLSCLGQRIFDLIKGTGFNTLTEFSQKANISYTSLRTLLQVTKNPGVYTVQSVAKALGVTVDELLANNENDIDKLHMELEVRKKYRDLSPKGKQVAANYLDLIAEMDGPKDIRTSIAALCSMPYTGITENDKADLERWLQNAYTAG